MCAVVIGWPRWTWSCRAWLPGVTVRRLRAGAGLANVRFGALSRLAGQLAAAAPGQKRWPQRSPLLVSAAVRMSLLRGSGPLSRFADHPGTIGQLERVFGELDEAEADPGALERISRVSVRGAEVVARYRTYQEVLAGFAGPRDLMRTATTVVVDGGIRAVSPVVLFAPGRLCAVERDLVRALARSGRLHAVCPTVADAHADPGADPDGETVDWLAGLLPDRIRIEDRTVPDRRIVVAPDAEEEVRFAIRRVVAELAAGVPPHRLACVYSARVPYARLFDEQLAAAGIPYHVSALATLADGVAGRSLTGGSALPVAGTWAETAAALEELLADQAGRLDVPVGWERDGEVARRVRAERDGIEAGLSAVDGLRVLDGFGYPAPTPHRVRQLLDVALSAPLGGGTTLGRGVTVAQIDDLAGADLDVVVMVGLAEGRCPVRRSEDPILGDAERRAGDCGLPLLADRRREDRARFLGAIGAGRTVVLSYPRADLRAQRALHPSPWLLEVASACHGRAVSTADLAHPGRAAEAAGWLTWLDSFESALRATPTPLSNQEYDVQLALSGAEAVVAGVDSRYARGRQAVLARRDGRFGPWLGAVDPLPEVLADRLDQAWSATGVQTWAHCPHRFLLTYLLGVRAADDPGDGDRMSALDRGSLVHRVLEALFAEAAVSPKPPSQAWTNLDLTRAYELLDEHAAGLVEAGQAGRGLVWRVQRAKLRRQLAGLLRADSAWRARRGAWPVAVEDPFGQGEAPPLVIALDEAGVGQTAGAMVFRGVIDRVDATADGRLIVVDYKTGRSSRYKGIPAECREDGAGTGGSAGDRSGDSDGTVDLVDRGRRLQLALYGLAARARHGQADTPVEGWFWFLEQDDPLVESKDLRRGGPIGAAAELRLRQVLGVCASGIRGGVFPARPGEAAWTSWENCGCPYDRACASTRGETWERVRQHPAVAGYAALAEDVPEDVLTRGVPANVLTRAAEGVA
jgi:hypothetical protein